MVLPYVARPFVRIYTDAAMDTAYGSTLLGSTRRINTGVAGLSTKWVYHGAKSVSGTETASWVPWPAWLDTRKVPPIMGERNGCWPAHGGPRPIFFRGGGETPWAMGRARAQPTYGVCARHPRLNRCMGTILVVDDAAFHRSQIRDLVVELGHQAIEAVDGVEAIQLYVRHKPDAVLLDVAMTTMDGLTALKDLLKLDPSAKVCMLTAANQLSTIELALERGAKDYVLKPLNKPRIKLALENMLAST